MLHGYARQRHTIGCFSATAAPRRSCYFSTNTAVITGVPGGTDSILLVLVADVFG